MEQADVSKGKLTARSLCDMVKTDGSPCQAPSLRGGSLCYQHSADPIIAEERALARRDGGHARHLRLADGEGQAITIRRSKDVLRLVGRVMTELWAGRMNARTATALCYAASVAVKTLEQTVFEDRIASLERVVLERKEYAYDP